VFDPAAFRIGVWQRLWLGLLAAAIGRANFAYRRSVQPRGSVSERRKQRLRRGLGDILSQRQGFFGLSSAFLFVGPLLEARHSPVERIERVFDPRYEAGLAGCGIGTKRGKADALWLISISCRHRGPVMLETPFPLRFPEDERNPPNIH
jgi:hypothetical protein